MTAADITPDLVTLRKRVVEMSAAADVTLRAIAVIARQVDDLHHVQQNLRQALVLILDHLDQIAPSNAPVRPHPTGEGT